MKTKLIFSFGLIPLILATLFLTVATSMDANAQNNTAQVSQQPLDQTADPQQIKNYLNGAIQALDSGNNTQAEQQLDLADDQMEILTGSAAVEDDDAEEEEGVEEGPGEDADEQGDIDVNDKEDTP
ncbi:hypothetical protein NMY3_00226 [Candidatus Nitrosocosmicus oleophilus]|jgi:hypothetical protein|uniref:Uncharacterized protein n=1 Tax=Candidatus Nitrosocosmicus oleophilus TaxID=1353260 RepID=A0A654LUF8_9ARCH|nr:hypothetical protein [Candidatus Nitrosocosmicus oleophilus]ALI34440.1 hypothetical protein NMY3_00226 [Candidatus Nitrosocosmicus oleophilus]